VAEWNTTRQRLMLEGLLRVGRRTPQTLYASFSDDLDDRTTNYPIGFVAEEDLSRFIAEAVQEKLARARRPADSEAWLADQLAQLPLAGGAMDMRNDVCLEPGVNYGRWTNTLVPGSASFTAIEKLAQEYGEMCAARALEGAEVDVQMGIAGGFDGVLSSVGGKLVVRPK